MNPTQDTLDLVKGALATPDDRIGKTISTSTGLLAFDLQMPAKNLYPFVTPLRNSIPRVGGGSGSSIAFSSGASAVAVVVAVPSSAPFAALALDERVRGVRCDISVLLSRGYFSSAAHLCFFPYGSKCAVLFVVK